MIYMPVDHLKQLVVAWKFWKHWVASGAVQRCTGNFSTLVELTGIIEWLLQAMHCTMELLCTQEVGYCVESWQGKSPSAYISAIYNKLAVIKRE